MLRYWYKLNGDLLNYGIGNELLSNTGVYDNTYPKMLYKNSYKCFSGTDVSDTDVAINLSEKLDIYSCSIWYYVDEFDSLDLYNNVSLIYFLSNKTYIPNVSSTDIRHWRNCVITYDGTTYRSYVDGKQRGVNVADYKLLYKINLHAVGNWKGALCDIKIFDHVLSNKEIEELSIPLLVHLPFNYICVPSLNLENYVPGQGYVNYTSILTKDSSVQTGSLPNIPKEWIMEHLGETVCASAYIYSLGSYTAGTINGSFGIRYALKYIDINNIEKQIYPLCLCVPGLNELYYVTWTIPSDIKSCTTDLIINNYTLGVLSNPEFGATPDLYGVTWTFSHFKVELGDYPTNPFSNSQLVEDISGHNYNGIIIDSPKVCLNTPRYDCGIKLERNYPQSDKKGTIVLLDFYDNYGTLLLDTFTISFWVRIIKNNENKHTQIFGIYNGNGLIFSMLQETPYGFKISKYISGIHYSLIVNKTYESNTWYHCVFVYDNSSENKYNIYLNGESQTLYGNLTNNIIELPNIPIIINRLSFGYLDMSDFRIYRTALSDLQIKDLYNEASSIDDNGDVFSRELIEYEYINRR